MAITLKKLNQQVLVITGATSGIGLVTARMAADRGAKLVLVSRNEKALKQLCEEIAARGTKATYVVADVGNLEDVAGVAEKALERFGSIDTWINNAGVSAYGGILQIPIEDQRRIFETNYWGVVYGSRVACESLRATGGALINIGSVLSDRAIPLQGPYSASKHAVKGFTDALRMELEKEGAPISVTLIKPSAIDTPYKEHAANYLEVEPDNPPPVYAPQVVASAILHCCEHPERDVFIGAGGKILSTLGKYAPELTDVYQRMAHFSGQKSDKPKMPHRGGLHSSGTPLQERGEYEGRVMKSSLYTKASLHPFTTGAIMAGATAALAAFLYFRSENVAEEQEAA
jgi:short-subunit dehydrogenase